jgi:hypothetical protein
MKRPCEKPKHRWTDNIKMNLKEIGCKGLDWVLLALRRIQWLALVDMAMNLQTPQKQEDS